jgi:shikimate dehydrogenase
MITSKTKICISLASEPGTFGSSFHNKGYELAGLDYIYIPRKALPDQLEGIIASLRELDIVGCGISMPHKVEVMKYLDEIDEDALRVGAVNTITIKDKILKGYNTDVYGAKRTIQENLDVKGKDVLLLGAGGAAKAVGTALYQLGANIKVSNRTEEKAYELASKINAKVIDFNSLNNLQGELLINATSVGMKNLNDMPVSREVIKNFNTIMDIVLYPRETRLLKEAKSLNKKTISGLSMTVYQAAKQFKLYTGQEPPKELLTMALNDAI